MVDKIIDVPEGIFFMEDREGIINLYYDKNKIEEIRIDGKFRGYKVRK